MTINRSCLYYVPVHVQVNMVIPSHVQTLHKRDSYPYQLAVGRRPTFERHSSTVCRPFSPTIQLRDQSHYKEAGGGVVFAGGRAASCLHGKEAAWASSSSRGAWPRGTRRGRQGRGIVLKAIPARRPGVRCLAFRYFFCYSLNTSSVCMRSNHSGKDLHEIHPSILWHLL